MSLDATAANAGNLYLVAGTLAGTRPGLTILGFDVSLNFPVYTNSVGFLDARRGTASFILPASPTFAGATVNHAFGVLDISGNIPHISRPCGALTY